MDEIFRNLVIDTLKRGEELPREWAREVFPPEKREYELVYYGKDREEDILAETMAVPLQPVRTFGKNGSDDWQNMLIFGDNLQVLKRLLEMKNAGELCNADGTSGVRLVYIDPPFATKQEFRGSQDQKAYQDKIIGASFIEFLRKRLIIIRELLSSNGSIYIHLDWRKAHYIRVILDEVFGEDKFMSEIIWQRHDPHNDAMNRYGRIHDVIFWYRRIERPIYNYSEIVDQLSERAIQEYSLVQLADGTIVNWLEQALPPGARRFKLDDCTVKGSNADRKFEWRGAKPSSKRQWPYDSPEEMDLAVASGDFYLRNPNKGAARCRKSFLDSRLEAGQLAQDIWLNLGRMKGGSSYPTEKPELLIDRIVRASSNRGDIVLDAFAGSGTACAVAEKSGRRWIGIDIGKLAIYTTQKRMLNQKTEIGNKGKALKVKPFTLYNAGLYDFSMLRQLPWDEWRWFALQLFECKDEPHTVGGLKLDGKRKGASVLVFNHLTNPGKRIDEETVEQIHAHIGNKVGNKVYIIAPSRIFDFQQDYVDLGGVRYYAMRIPYSIINELHRREFTALLQPRDERAVNDTVDAIGFDFIQPPKVEWTLGIKRREGQLLNEAFLKIKKFESRARLRNEDVYGGPETLSMLMIDYDYKDGVFDFDAAFYNNELEAGGWQAHFPHESIGENLMAVFIDIHGNEARHLIPRKQFGLKASQNGSLSKKGKK
jgi:site-specific DNA-methyltransferase (adenine-specific)/adenine-specific DNA-methyltransferase